MRGDCPHGSEDLPGEVAELRARVESLESALRRGGRWLRALGPPKIATPGAARGRFVYVATDGTRWEWAPAGRRVAPAILDEIESKLRARIVDRDRACELGLLLIGYLRPR